MIENEAEFFIERMDYGETGNEYGYLYFGCTINNKRILFSPILSNSADGIYVDDVALSRAILYCGQIEREEIENLYGKYNSLIMTYYELAVYGHQGYPLSSTKIKDVLALELTDSERSKVLEVYADYTYIYLIKDNRTGYIKIGRSNNPTERIKTLIKQDTLLPQPNEFEFITLWEAPYYYERLLHKEFSNKRVRGEWFNLNEDDITKARHIVKYAPEFEIINEGGKTTYQEVQRVINAEDYTF